MVVGGLVATLLGGMLGDYLRNRGVKGAYFLVAGWGMIVAFPAFLAMLYAAAARGLGLPVRGGLLPVLQHRSGEHRSWPTSSAPTSGPPRSPSTS